MRFLPEIVHDEAVAIDCNLLVGIHRRMKELALLLSGPVPAATIGYALGEMCGELKPYVEVAQDELERLEEERENPSVVLAPDAPFEEPLPYTDDVEDDEPEFSGVVDSPLGPTTLHQRDGESPEDWVQRLREHADAAERAARHALAQQAADEQIGDELSDARRRMAELRDEAEREAGVLVDGEQL